MSETRFPAVQRYTEQLPEGLDSYPQCRAKASLLRGMVASRPQVGSTEGLPSDVTELLRSPPPVNTWIPETLFNAAALAIYDREFGGDNLEGFEHWVYQINRDIFRKPLYRVLFLLISPRRLLINVARRWGAFHRGSNLTLLESTDDEARLRLEFPPYVFSEEMIYAFGGAWRAAADTAGAYGARSDLERTSESVAEYHVRWH